MAGSLLDTACVGIRSTTPGFHFQLTGVARGAMLPTMSTWDDQHVLEHVLTALESVPLVNDAHHFGRPWLTAYQLAIKVHALAPEVANALGVTVGGKGAGAKTSLAQYLARELSRRIKADHGFPVEGAFLSNDLIRDITYDGPSGVLRSSVTHSGYDLSLFRRA